MEAHGVLGGHEVESPLRGALELLRGDIEKALRQTGAPDLIRRDVRAGSVHEDTHANVPWLRLLTSANMWAIYVSHACICLSGYGALQDFSIRNTPAVSAMADGHLLTDCCFATLRLPEKGITRMLEGPMPVERPATVAEVCDVVRRCAADGTAIYPVGGGTLLDYGTPPSRSGIALSTAKLDQVIGDQPAAHQ